MAQIPTVISPSVGPGGGQELRGRGAMPFQAANLSAGAAGTAEGQGAAIGRALRELGQDVGQVAETARRTALTDMALANETMALEADTAASDQFRQEYSSFAALQGKDAVAGQDASLARLRELREAAVKTMPNDQARMMLNRSLVARERAFADSIVRRAADENQKWMETAARGAARGATDQASVFRNVPALADQQIAVGEGNVLKLGELHGWDKDTLDANVREYRGRSVGMLVDQLIGDGKTDDAVAMFDRWRDRMDAQSAGRISQTLKPVVQRRDDENRVAGFMGRMPPATPQQVAQAIEAQESGGRDGLVSVDGARGARQIMPGTFAQYAQPGEDINNPADNRAVGDRIIADYHQRYGGDAERIAVAYFSGPGNVAPVGSPTPWKEDKKDGNGVTVSKYVADVTARMGRPAGGGPDGLGPAGTYERPDFDAARAKARAAAGGDFAAEQRWVSMITARETAFNSATNAQRVALDSRLDDVDAALRDGRPVAIPEGQIRALYPRAKADELILRLEAAQEQGIAAGAVRFMSPEDYAQALDSYSDVGPPPPDTAPDDVKAGYAKRQQARKALEAGWSRSREELKADPAQYVMRNPAVGALATAEAMSAPGGPERYAAAALAEQARLGVPEADRRVLPKQRAADLVHQITSLDPKTASIIPALGEMEKQYGAMWPSVWADMVRTGLPAQYAVLGTMTAPDQVGARGDAQRMLMMVAEKGGEANLRRALESTGAPGAGNSAKMIDDALGAALAPFQETTRFAGGPDQYRRVAEFVRNMAYSYALQGATPNDAVRYAVDGVLKMRYDFDGTMRVPRGQGPMAATVTHAIQAKIGDNDVAIPPDAGPLAADQRARVAAAARNGFWVTNANDDGVVLYANYQNINAGGIPIRVPVRRADGGLFEVKFRDLQRMHDTLKQEGPEFRPATQGVSDAEMRRRARQSALPAAERDTP